MYLGLTHGKIKTNIFKKETLPYVFLCMYLCLPHRRSKICHFEFYIFTFVVELFMLDNANCSFNCSFN